MKDRGIRSTPGAELAAVLLLAGLCLGFLWQTSLAGRIVAGPDAFTYFYPMYEYAAARLSRGELPLWNPHLFMGAPFLANPQAGVFYPLHWLLRSLPVPSMASVILCVHYCLMGWSTYALLRLGLRLRAMAAFGGAVVMMLGGVAGAQAEHFNQVETFAWLPLQLLILELALLNCRNTKRRGVTARRVWWLIAFGAVSALQLVAGHFQSTYICHVCAGLYLILRIVEADGLTWEAGRRICGGLGFIGLGVALAAGVGAAQALPTLELARLSARSGGMPYRQAVSFSFGPKQWLLGLLPHFAEEPVFSEYLAYVGVTGLFLAALGGRRGTRHVLPAIGLVVAGVLLALGGYNPGYYVLYKIVPGIALFRAPARWLLLVNVGLVGLISQGLERVCAKPLRFGGHMRAQGLIVLIGVAGLGMLWAVSEPKPHLWTVVGWGLAVMLCLAISTRKRAALRSTGVLVLLVCELSLASRSLPYNVTTAPQIYQGSRRAQQVLLREGGLSRFLTISAGEFDPGDMKDILATVGIRLGKVGSTATLVSSKWQETVARNLALHQGLYAMDGYDGGVLPLETFVNFQRLYIPGNEVALDGRMSESLRTVPSSRLLALANVGYVVMDRLNDLWIGGVYYDIASELEAGVGAEEWVLPLPETPFTSIGVVLSDGGGTIHQGRDALCRLELQGGRPEWFALWFEGGGVWARRHDGLIVSGEVVPEREGLYHIELPLERMRYAEKLAVAMQGGTGGFAVRAVSLIERATSAGVPVALGTVGGLRPIHYGDVKIARVENTLPRAYFSACARLVSTCEQALGVMAQADWDPRSETILVDSSGTSFCGGEPGEAVIREYAPERVVVDVDAPSDGYLVLSDTYYPGWVATVDGRPEKIVRANYLFRAVSVPKGGHVVEFVYRPNIVRLGLLVSGASVGVAVLVLLATAVHICKRDVRDAGGPPPNGG